MAIPDHIKWRRRAVYFAIILFAIYGLYKWAYPTVSWNQRMTVEVAVDGETVSSSVVSRVVYRMHPRLTAEVGSFNRRMPEGEAVHLEINGRHLFALLRGRGSGDYAITLATALYRDRFGTSNDLERDLYALKQRLGTQELPPARYPMLVTFTDINDPKSVTLVDPENLAAAFGAGVELKRITLEITGEAVSDQIENVLPWLPQRRAGYLDGASTSHSTRLSNRLHYGHLKRD